MLDWFDEPLIYFAHFAPMRARVFDHMAKWMDSVDKAMEEEFGEFYDTFYDPNTAKQALHANTTNTTVPVNATNATTTNATMVNQTNINATADNETEDETEYYSISSSMYSVSDGIQHIYREEVDSKTGKKKVVETKRIGNKSLTLHRVTDKDGHVEEHVTRKNIKDDELEAFNKDWISRKVPETAKLPEPEKNQTKTEEKPLPLDGQKKESHEESL